MPAPIRPLLLGHRGARAVRSIPENTVDSFDRALADGCDGFEFDVRRTADGQAVICHDPRSGGVEIADASADEVDRLPHLDDILSRYQERAFLDIELKVRGIETITVELLQKYPPRRGFVVSSFSPEVLLAIRAEDARVPLGLICETRSELLRWKELPVEYVMPHHKLGTAALLRELKDAGKKSFVWTVNDPAEMVRFRNLGADGIISDDTSLLCSISRGPHRS
ncbi:MAG TPA: glycerophosphodiester phosphodiesterase [Candidatus Sulfotelmatobacter sp.]|nr:glycerophosphodiester phosphodiesterase [Candidatus Sulfotelmatobacter sp.]